MCILRLCRRLIVMLILLIILTIYLSVPFYSGLYYSVNIGNDVKIYRESNGIPHIHASNIADGYYGLGYVHAQDRLWQLHIRRMASQGRLSEIFGYDENILGIDKYIRNLGYLESSRRIVDKFDPQIKQYMQAYVNGINDGYKSLLVLPIEFQILNIEFEEWTIYDSMAFVKLMALGNVSDQFLEFMRSKFDEIYDREIAKVVGAVGPDNQFGKIFTVIDKEELKEHTHHSLPHQNYTQQIQNVSAIDVDALKKSLDTYYSQYLLPTFKGSNAWIIDGNHTQSGKPHLANDPHLDNSMPCQWYQAEILYHNGEEENFIIGATLPGVPMALSGRSKYFGWGMTTLYSDGGDIFEEHIKFENGSHYYEYNGEWHQVRYTEETIKIKNHEQVSFTMMHTHRGPILEYYRSNGKLEQFNGKYYSLQCTIHIDDSESAAGFMKFQTGKDFIKSLEHMKGISYPNSGLVFISKDGHIAYLSSGRLVIRNGHPDHNGFVKPGWTNEKDWIGYVNKTEQPLVIDPSKGFMVCGNNKFMPDSNKYLLTWNTQPTARGKRLTEQIQKHLLNGLFSIDDHMKLQSDVTDSYAEAIVPMIIELIEQNAELDGVKRNLGHALKILKQWNYATEIESNGALLYQTFEFIYAQKFHDQLDTPTKLAWYSTYIFDSFFFKHIYKMYYKEEEGIREAQYCANGPKTNKCLINMITSLEEAYNLLIEKYGNDTTQWKWGNDHYQLFPHAMSKYFGWLFDRRIPYKGNSRTPHVSQLKSREDGQFDGLTGSNYKMIISMDDDEPNYYIVDTGVSGNVFSKHYDDQQQLWRKGEYIQMKFGKRDDYEHLIVIRSIGNEIDDIL